MEYESGKYNETLFEGFDTLIDEMGKHGMKAVVPMNNFWEWSGGMGVEIGWAKNGSEYHGMPYQWYTDPVAQTLYKNFIEKVMTRNNTKNGLLYKEDPTIMAWQLANEPRTNNCDQYKKWMSDIAFFIKDVVGTEQLVSLGNENMMAKKRRPDLGLVVIRKASQ